jgi:hypothetical protein
MDNVRTRECGNALQQCFNVRTRLSTPVGPLFGCRSGAQNLSTIAFAVYLIILRTGSQLSELDSEENKRKEYWQCLSDMHQWYWQELHLSDTYTVPYFTNKS